LSVFQAIDPHTGEVGSVWAAHAPEEVEAALARAERAQQGWAARALHERLDLLGGVAVALEGAAPRLARLAALEVGKPIAEGEAEVRKCALALRVVAERAPGWLAEERVQTEAAWSGVLREPVGVILGIMPWNFPFWQVFRFAASALAAGNAAVVKHAPSAPACAAAIEALALEAGLPAGLLTNLRVGHDAIPGLIADRRVAAVTLTGSTRAGRAVAALAGAHLKRCVLELGGSDAFVVLADADLDAAVQTAVRSRCLNAGQSCIAAKRFVVEAPVAAAFEARFREALASLVVGDPREPGVQVGPLARADLRDTLAAQVRGSLALGARRVLGGAPRPGPGFHFETTLLADCRPGMPVWDEETFGPVAALAVVGDEAELLRLAAHPRYALACTVFGRDLARARAIADRIPAGGSFVNAMVRSDPRLPFGGARDSGWGRELGREGMLEWTQARTVWVER
jgi:succinate-semialdehyde dehydrogenase/glutarate-semialdehyde dehydrogenase